MDNCPSRFWQLLEGSQVCQYGHVREGLQVGEDEDAFVHGRRIKRPKLTVVEELKESKLVFGKEAEAILASALQKVLQLQTKYMVANYVDHKDYTRTVKALWLAFLKGVKAGKLAGKVTLSARHNVIILYLACVLCRAPFYLVDFWRSIYRYEFPYFDAYEQLFGEQQDERLPSNLIDRMHPRHLPGPDKLYTDARTLALHFQKHEQLHFPDVMPGPLVFKTIRDLLLPPLLYDVVFRLFNIMDAKFGLTSSKFGVRAQSPENMVVCTVAVAVKLCYGLDGKPRGRNPDSIASDEFDWTFWNNLVTKLWLLDDEYTYADERQVIYWDSEKVDRYLQWFQRFVKSEAPSNETTVAKKRLLKMFPLADIAPADTVGSKEYETVVPELAAALHETSELKMVAGPNPGSDYPQYNSVGESDWYLPEQMDTLYAVCARFLNVTPERFRAMMYRVEGYLRHANRDIYLTMEKNGDELWRPPTRLPSERLARRRATQERHQSESASSSRCSSITPGSSILPSPSLSYLEDDNLASQSPHI